MAQYYEDFRDYDVGDVPPDFNQAWGTGFSFLVASTNILEDSDRRLIIGTNTSAYLRDAIEWDVGTTSGDTTVRLLMKVRASASARHVAGAVISGSGTISTRTGYTTLYANNNRIVRHSSGSESTLASETISTSISFVDIWLELRRNGSSLEYRYWLFGDSRPASPTLSTTDGSPLPVSGFFGISLPSNTEAIDAELYSIAVATDGDAVPTGPVTPSTTITASGAVQEQTIGNVTLTQGSSLAPNSLSQQVGLESLSLTQDHSLSAQGIAQAQAVEAATLTQANDLTPSALAQEQTAQSATLTQAHIIVPASLGQGQDIAASNLIQAHVIAPDGLAQVQAVNSPNLTVAGDVLVNALSQATGLDAAQLTQAHVLTLNPITQSHALATVSLTAADELLLADMSQSQALQGVTLTEAQILAVTGLAQSQSVEEATLSLADLLNIDSLGQTQALDESQITQAYVLSVNNLTQAQITQAVNFGGLVIGSLNGEIKIYALVDGAMTIEPALKGNITIH